MEAFFPEKVTDNGVLPEEYCNGDILLTNEVRLIEQAHGYGVGLLAVDGVLNSLPSLNEGLVVLDPSGLTMDKKAGFDHKATEDKLIKCWGLLDLRYTQESARDTRRSWPGGLGTRDHRLKT